MPSLPRQPHPTASGTYRIEVYRSPGSQISSSAYLKHVHTGNVHWIQLSPLTDSASDAKFKWRLDRVSGTTDVYTIRPSSDLWIGMVPTSGQAGSDKSYGTIEGRWASAANWRIQKSQDGLYSRIMNESAILTVDCRDETEDRRLHLWAVQDDAPNQRYVFESLDDVVGIDTSSNTTAGVAAEVYDRDDQGTISDFNSSRGTSLSSSLSSPSDTSSDWGITSPTGTGGGIGLDGDEAVSSVSYTGRSRRTSLSSNNTSLADYSSRQRTSASASTSTLSLTSRWDASDTENTTSSTTRRSERPSFQSGLSLFTLEAAAKETYDIIIIGSTLGASVLATDLFSTNTKLGPGGSKNVLVIENCPVPGKASTHSHRLNISPQVHHSATRIEPSTLQTQLGSALYTELSRKWYTEAEQLMDVSLPPTNALQLGIIERLDMECGGRDGERGCLWGWARLASSNPIDRLPEIATSKQRDSTTLKLIEHSNFKTLANTEVRSIEWGDGQTGKAKATGVLIRDRKGREATIRLSPTGLLVLGAGSLECPAILMRSGLDGFLEDNGGLHLTSPDIRVRSTRIHFLDESAREKAGSMKLQSYVRLRSGQVALAIISIEVDPSGSSRASSGRLTSTFTLPDSLNRNNTIRLNFKDEPVVEAEAGSESPYSRADRDRDLAELRDFDQVARKVLKEMLRIHIHGDVDADDNDDEDYFTPLDLGSPEPGHGVGTIPLKSTSAGRTSSLQAYCLEQNLQLRGHSNIFVCDLSLFPFSPGVDPSLTLVAFALRLSRTIHPREPEVDRSTLSYQDQLDSKRSVVVVNHTGERIKIRVSNVAGVRVGEDEMQDKGERVLGPGERVVRLRKKGVDEVVLVYRLEDGRTPEEKKFGTRPVAYVTTPGYETPCIVE